MGPSGWAFAYAGFFEIAFALITLAIGIFAFKIYRFNKQHSLRNFSLSFVALSGSFFVLAGLHLFGEYLVQLLPFLDKTGLTRLALASHMALYIVGAITLAYMTLKVRSDMTYAIMIIITFFAIVAATHKLYLFYSIASVLFGTVFWYYAKRKSHLVSLGFGALFLANVALIFSVQNPVYYLTGHVLELAGYVFLLINFINVLRT